MVEKKNKRSRRTPEEARELILKAAERVFSEHLPDVVGLKEVAGEAGVSHALVTHYFGTYDALVEATLERRFQALRDDLLPTMLGLIATDADVGTMLDAHRQAFQRATSDSATVRLLVWALLSGRAAADDFFTHRMQGLKLLADALEARSTAPREELEFLLMAAFALSTTWLFAGRALAGSLGKKAVMELGASYEEKSQAMIRHYLRNVEQTPRS